MRRRLFSSRLQLEVTGLRVLRKEGINHEEHEGHKGGRWVSGGGSNTAYGFLRALRVLRGEKRKKHNRISETNKALFSLLSLLEMLSFSTIVDSAENARSNVERFLSGWKYGSSKDIDKRISPFLVPFDYLPLDIKEYGRENVREIPEVLAHVEKLSS